ncbi:DUF927 domain-containing protein [Albimonas sp. CAU 1670]|uniref:DUF927 domain-containing protein n=1 Tax=Albimonas sp. CAU 1670 TaxID=3032599 RepID=UPI0023DBE806|nr:DUF927 domain-containing protein [Albimonas sp. CAU 1670]MDF2233810.1 DUF927 domain-containing protein [Albimonas sp. CAU 1670]
MALHGMLLREGWDVEAVAALVHAVSVAAGGAPELGARLAEAKDAAARLVRGDVPVFGFNTLADLMGEPVVKQALAWLDIAALGSSVSRGGATGAAGAAGLPRGFVLRKSGIFRLDKDEKGEEQPRFLCSPVKVVALSCDAHGGNWGRVLEITDPDGSVHRWNPPARPFAGDGTALREELMSVGFELESSPKGRSALNTLLQRWKPSRRALVVERMGWVDDACDAFVLGGDRALGRRDVIRRHESDADAAQAMTSRGGLSDWDGSIGERRLGDPAVMFGVLVALSGPLLELLNVPGGGFHLRGASSRGKTTIQKVAASVWGSADFIQTWRATANGLEGVASVCNGTLLVLDELGEVHGREAGAAACMLANGRGKVRANKNGTARRQATWRLNFLSSGEQSLERKVAEAGGKTYAGRHVRFLDLPIDDRAHGVFDDLHGDADGGAVANRLNDLTAESCGAAGPAFVEAIIADPDAARRFCRERMERFRLLAIERVGLDGMDAQVSRALDRFALIFAAGSFAVARGIVGWTEEAVEGAVLTVFRVWLEGRGGRESHEMQEIVEQLSKVIERYGSSRFVAIGQAAGRLNPSPVRDMAGWFDGASCYVKPAIWKEETMRGLDPQRAARRLADLGVIRRDADGRLTTKAPRVNGERPRVYAVHATALRAIIEGEEGGDL